MVAMSRNQQDAEARKRHRERKIAQVQRERDIAEVFGEHGIYDKILSYSPRFDRYKYSEAYGKDLLNPFRSYLDSSLSDVPIIVNASNCKQPEVDLSDWCLEENEPHYTIDTETNMILRSAPINLKEYPLDIRTPFKTTVFEFREKETEKAAIKTGWVVGFRETQSHHGTNRLRFVIWRMNSGSIESNVFGTVSDTHFAFYPNDVRAAHMAFVIVYTALCTFNLMKVSNIELIDQPPNPRLSAISEREFGRPLTTYKVLKVNTGHKEYQGRDKDTGLKDFDPRRMHVVRGHHAEYGTNGRKLLFGKYQRKIWIPAHVRGNEELGIVVKDYEVVDDPTA